MHIPKSKTELKMGIFRPYIYKPKPDLPSDAPVKHGFFLFWEIFFRKIWRLVTVNIYYFIITFPLLVVFHLTINQQYLIFLHSSGLIEMFEDPAAIDIFTGVGFITVLATYIPRFIWIPLLVISAVLYGPATMGATYIYRNFTREEHAWTSDFFSRGLKNFKQGLFFGILDIVMVCVLSMGILGGASGGSGFAPYLSVIIKILSVFALVYYLFMRTYMYIMAVTFDLSVFAIIKNAMIFVIVGFLRNIWATLVSIIAFLICFMSIPLMSLITIPFIFYSFTGFASVFICYPIIKKYLIVPAMEMEEKKKTENNISANNEENTDTKTDQ